MTATDQCTRAVDPVDTAAADVARRAREARLVHPAFGRATRPLPADVWEGEGPETVRDRADDMVRHRAVRAEAERRLLIAKGTGSVGASTSFR
jgi:hypothetical protein